MTEMLEQVARALCDGDDYKGSWDATCRIIAEGGPNAEHARREHDEYLRDARRAVEALREPDDQVRCAGLVALVKALEEEQEWLKEECKEHEHPVEGPMMPIACLMVRSSKDTDAVWQAMIDAILTPDKEGT